MLPTVFINHGAGPFPLMGQSHHVDLVRTWSPGEALHQIVTDPRVRAIVIISAHYETVDAAVEVMADPAPGLLFDYTGFPQETYTYTLPNPGSPSVATRVVELLSEAGIVARTRSGRGHDHGTFVPMLGLGLDQSRPNLPVISVSIRGPGVRRDGIEDDHVRMGQALAPLRSEGILVLGSGNSIHGRCAPEQAQAFDDHLGGLAARGPLALREWDAHPMGRVCHPRPEHILPLLICAGAGETDRIETIPHQFFGFAASHMIFRSA